MLLYNELIDYILRVINPESEEFMKQLVNLVVCAALSLLIGLILGAGIGGYEYQRMTDEIKDKE